MRQNNLYEDVTTQRLKTYANELYKYNKLINIKLLKNTEEIIKSYNSKKNVLENYDLFFKGGGLFSKLNKGIFIIINELIKNYGKAFKYFKPSSIDFENIKTFVLLNNSYYALLKLTVFINDFLKRSEEEKEKVENFIKYFLRYIKLFKKLEARTVNGIKETNIDSVSTELMTLVGLLEQQPQFKKRMSLQKMYADSDVDKAIVEPYIKNLTELNNILRERDEALNPEEEPSTQNQNQKKEKNNSQIPKKKLSKKKQKKFMQAVKDLVDKMRADNLGNEEDIEKSVRNFVASHMQSLVKEAFITEAMPQIRWRKNPRLGLNKIVLVCKSSEYKKSLNRDITISGKKVKDVICLPKSAKPATQRMKDRKASLKRWKTLRSKPAQMRKIKFKRKETRRQSKTIRKET